MSQATANISNMSRTLFRAAVNAVLQAIQTWNSGASEPAEKYPFMPWVDETTGWLKQRNAANTGWIKRFPIGTGARVDVASAATLDLTATAVTSDYVRITGTTAITAITLEDGQRRVALAGGAFKLTNSSNLIVPGAADYTTTAGDVLLIMGEASGVVRLAVFKSDGASVVGGGSGGLKNRLINGGFDIWQRGTSFAPSSSIYTADRWNANNTSVTNSQVAAPAGSGVPYYMRATTTNVSNLLQHYQPLESQIAKSLQGGSATFSINALCSSGAVSAFLRIYKNATADTLLGGAWSLISEQAITITTTDTRFSVTAAIPSDGTANGIRAGITFTNAANGITVDYGKAQLEPGSTATPFEFRPIATELALCQRYYQRFGDSSVNYAISLFSYGAASNVIGQSWSLPVTMRADPTATKVGTWNVSNCGQPSVGGSSKCSLTLQASMSGTGSGYFNTNAVGQYVELSAEL